ncbi:hypothetical protein HELRODRAFT_62512 [Helobdella robusta]|uniref:Alkyl transferase n=1 Tax=Helobdella robusta TaxID=6412 RepID=T1FX17_HELRO|nr:hypothetical protein HELRODRAFT_62512 [Helobdella robusta]ESO13012.1 hypothetical protein HELRODRAFT_62512 [Helobdella robusta]
MSTWIREDAKRKKSWIQSLCESVLKSGYVPKHVAVIMDGNRRYADKNNYKRSVGHLLGFNKVTETLEWCMGLGINEVTLYAFSLENFKRSKEEIDGLMELARQKFTALLAEKELISKHGLCLRIIGNMDYLPIDIQQLFAEGIHSTKDNNKAFLNICCAYTSREEMTNTMVQIVRGVSKGLIKQSDIDEDLFEKCLYTRHSTEPDLVIRTSGEVRLSDFLLWQSSYSFLSFTKVLWPEYSWCHFYSGIYYFQRNYQAIKVGWLVGWLSSRLIGWLSG